MTNHTHPHKIVALRGCMALTFAALLLAAAIHAETGLILTTRASNYNTYIGAGFVQKVSKDFAVVTDTYIGDGTANVQGQWLVLLPLAKKTTAFAAVGPELHAVQPTLTRADKIWYIENASTAGISYRHSPTWSSWLAIDRLDGKAPVATWKIAIGAIIWLGT